MDCRKTKKELTYAHEIEKHLKRLAKERPLSYIANNFCKYVRRQELTRFLFRYDIFTKILEIKGSIIECGVFSGNGLMAWSQLSTILEPIDFSRRIYGFDTFEGFPSIHQKDSRTDKANSKAGDIKDDCYEELTNCIELFNLNRLLSQFTKVTLIKGNFLETGETFLKENPHVLIALLYLDFDLYEPTKKALELFLPRMSRGSIIGFDEINNPDWPGETIALLESFDLKDIQIRKYNYEPNMSYIII